MTDAAQTADADARAASAAFLAALLLTAALCHRLASVAVARRVCSAIAGVHARLRRSPLDPDALGRAVHATGQRLPAVACLEEAVVAHAILAAHGVDASVHLGVAKHEPDDLAAHAWVTAGDRVLVGDEDHDLAAYERLPIERWP